MDSNDDLIEQASENLALAVAAAFHDLYAQGKQSKQFAERATQAFVDQLSETVGLTLLALRHHRKEKAHD